MKGPVSNATVVLSLMEITVTLICMYIPAVFTGRGQLYLSVHAEKLKVRELEMTHLCLAIHSFKKCIYKLKFIKNLKITSGVHKKGELNFMLLFP